MEQKNSYAIAALVLGIVSIVFSFIFVWVFVWVGLIAGVVGIILAVKGRKIEDKKGMATAGLVCSIIGTSLSGIFVVCALCVAGSIAGIASSL